MNAEPSPASRRTPSAPTRPYFGSLTALRYFAALAILIHHSIDPFRLGTPPQWFNGFRGTGVSFFFVLSGFVLAISLRGVSPPSWGDYYYRRFARIVPLYWAAALLAALGFLINNRWDRYVARFGFDATEVAVATGLHLTMLQAWLPNIDYVFFLNAPGWTLSVEAFFYAALPLLLLASTRRLVLLGALTALVLWPAAILASDALGNAPWGGRNTLTHFLPPVRLPEFIAGIIAARALLAKGTTPCRRPGWVAVGALVLIVGWCLTVSFASPGVTAFGSPGLATMFYECAGFPAFAIAIYLLARAEMTPGGPPLILRLLGSPPLVLLGNASYAIYLLHVPLRLTIPPRWLRAEEAFPVYMVGIHVLSVAAYLLLEIPARRALIALRPSSRAVPRPPAPAQP